MQLTLLAPMAVLLLPLALLPLIRCRQSGLPLSSLAPYAHLERNWRERLSRCQPALATAGLLLLVAALAEPALKKQTETTLRRGVHLMLALDISASMLADDIAPSRIDVARRTAAEFVDGRRDDRVGVILFSGIPYLLAPPTDDPAPVIDRLRRIRPDRLGTGTAIGDALAAATARLPRRQQAQSAVILLTDGSSNRGRITPLAAARAAASFGIRIYTIGFGSQQGAFVQPAPGRPPQKVVLDEAQLQQIAMITGGRYFRATGADELQQVYRQIDLLEKAPLETRQQIEQRPLQPLLLLIAGLLLGGELLLFRILLRRVA